MQLELTHDQALVLYEWLSRLDEKDAFPTEHEAEELVLWLLHGQLESALSEQFKPTYRALVEEARLRVRRALVDDE